MRPWVRGPWFAGVLALFVFLPWISRRDVVTSHEARVVQVARSMAESGWPWNARLVRVPQVEKTLTPVGERLVPRADGAMIAVNPWLVPIIGDTPRLQKPPLPYWCAAMLFRLFGESAGAARIVPAVLGALATLLIYDLATSLMGRRAAVYAALVWVSSYFVVDEFRKAMADPYLAFFVLATVASWIRASRRSSRIALIACYASAALAALAKGPVLFLPVLPILAAYHIGHRKPLPGRWRDHAVGFILFAMIALPWPIAIVATVDHALEFWRYQSLGTFADNVEKARAWWFYLPNLLLIGLPWTPLELLGVAWIWKHRDRRRLVPLTATIVIVVIFSASHVKKNAYLLPIMPLQTLLVVRGFMAVTRWLRRRGWPMRSLTNGLHAIAAGWAIAISLFLNGSLARQENLRSPRPAARALEAMRKADPAVGVWTLGLAEEASVYLPLNPMPPTECTSFIAIVNTTNSGHFVEQIHHDFDASAQVQAVTWPRGPYTRWDLFRLQFSHPPKLSLTAVEGAE